MLFMVEHVAEHLGRSTNPFLRFRVLPPSSGSYVLGAVHASECPSDVAAGCLPITVY